MGRLDLLDVYRDEDFTDKVESWKQTLAKGETTVRCDAIIAEEQGEIPPRLLRALAGVRTYARRRKTKAS